MVRGELISGSIEQGVGLRTGLMVAGDGSQRRHPCAAQRQRAGAADRALIRLGLLDQLAQITARLIQQACIAGQYARFQREGGALQFQLVAHQRQFGCQPVHRFCQAVGCFNHLFRAGSEAGLTGAKACFQGFDLGGSIGPTGLR